MSCTHGRMSRTLRYACQAWHACVACMVYVHVWRVSVTCMLGLHAWREYYLCVAFMRARCTDMLVRPIIILNFSLASTFKSACMARSHTQFRSFSKFFHIPNLLECEKNVLVPGHSHNPKYNLAQHNKAS